MRPQMTRSTAYAAQLVIACLVFCLARGPAQAAPLSLVPNVAVAAGEAGPRVAVVAVGLDPKARTQVGLLEHVGENALERSGRFEVVSLTDALQPDGYGKRLKAADEAEKKVAEAKKALDDLDNVKGLELLVEALNLYQQTDLSRRFQDYMKTWVLKAAAHATGGENDAAEAEMAKIIIVYPEAEFLSTFFPPDLIKFADDKRKAANAAAGEMTVNSVPPGARIWVDGTFRGTAPVKVEGLAQGKHIVTARLGGFAFAQEELGLGDQSLTLEEAEQGNTLLRAVNLMVKDHYGPTRDTATVKLGKALGVDQILLFEAKKSTTGEKVDLTGLRIEMKDGHNAAYATATLPMNNAKALEDFAEGLLKSDAPRKGGPVHHYLNAGGGTKKVAGFALMGAGAVLLGTGIVFGLQAQSRADAFHKTPQTLTQINANNASQGRTFSVVADISYVLAIAAGTTGGILAFTGGGPAAEPEPRRHVSRPPPPRDDGRKAREDEARRKREADERRRADDDRRREEEDRRKADEERRAQEEADRKAQEAENANSGRKLTRKELAEKKKREEEEKKKAEAEKKKAEEAEKKAEAERKLREEEERKRREAEERRKREQEEDLRNF